MSSASRSGAATACPGPSSRREFLRAGVLGMGGLTLADYFRQQAFAEAIGNRPDVPQDTSVIFLWLPGGPPHMETYDMKPEAPSDYRGNFSSIPTTVPGLDVCDLLPMHAKIAHKYNLIRSIAHNFSDHGGGHKRLMTGRDPKTPVDTVNDSPAVGSIVAKTFENRDVGIPNYVCGADNGRQGVDVFAMGSAYLGSAYTPFFVVGDPTPKDFKIPNLAPTIEATGRLDDRTRLLNNFDQYRRQADASGLMSSIDKFNDRAMGLLTSDAARRAFDLSLESDETRDRYGRHAWGQRALMARRLVEAGCKFVTMVLENPYQSGIPFLKQGTYNWDSHAVNCHMFDDLEARLPIYDRAITAIIEDLYERGLDKKVLLVVTGEFGRTPRITNVIGSQTGVMQPGRDHWPQAMSVLLAGGGMRTGQVIGSTNAKGEHPKDRPLTPNDLWATVYLHLGIDYERSFPDYRGRPMPILPYGEPIAELTV